MSTATALSDRSRLLTRISGLAFALLGLVFFLAPRWSADEFPWRVTDFMAMTMGGWCLGNAFMAWVAARDWRWASVKAVLFYLWTFAVVEIAVLIWFRDLLRFEATLAWPYLITLGLALLTAIAGVTDLIRLRPLASDPRDQPSPAPIRFLGVLFVVLVGFLAFKGLLDPESGQTRSVFPEPLSPFTIRAFAVFYGSIAVGAVPLVFARSLAPTTTYALGGMGLIVPITVAGFVYIGRFDFSDHPRQVIYLGAYIGVFVAAIGLMASARGRGRRLRSPELDPPTGVEGIADQPPQR